MVATRDGFEVRRGSQRARSPFGSPTGLIRWLPNVHAAHPLPKMWPPITGINLRKLETAVVGWIIPLSLNSITTEPHRVLSQLELKFSNMASRTLTLPFAFTGLVPFY